MITNVGGVANPRQIMEAHHDSLTLKEHNIDQGFKNDFFIFADLNNAIFFKKSILILEP